MCVDVEMFIFLQKRRNDVTDLEKEMLEVLKAQHDAIDILFAMLIDITPYPKKFFPSKSGKPWEAILKGNAVIDKAEALRA